MQIVQVGKQVVERLGPDVAQNLQWNSERHATLWYALELNAGG